MIVAPGATYYTTCANPLCSNVLPQRSANTRYFCGWLCFMYAYQDHTGTYYARIVLRAPGYNTWQRMCARTAVAARA